MLCLAKLHLATAVKLTLDPEVIKTDLNNVEMEMALLIHQEQLPTAVLAAFDLDANTMRVLTAQELIEVRNCSLVRVLS